MATSIGVSSKKIPSEAAKIAAALKTLREATGRTRDQMARAIECSYPIYGHWESGRTVPRYDDLQKIANSVADPALRVKFWLDIYSGGVKLGGTPAKSMAQREALIIRYGNDAIEAIQELSAGAARGSTASEEALRDLADRLVRAAGNTARLFELKKPPAKPAGK